MAGTLPISPPFGLIVGEAERGLQIPAAVTKKSLRNALVNDADLEDEKWVDEFLAVTLPPDK